MKQKANQIAKRAIERAQAKARAETPAGYWTPSYDRRGRLVRMFVPAK